ncbi:MAG: restriction endonuclease [Gammaproteobacteria bacterium]
MAADKTDLKWIVVFRTADLDDLKKRFGDSEMLFKELEAGRLRQGWGASGFSLLDAQGKHKIGKKEWEKNYQKCWGGKPSARRYSALTPMLEIEEGDVVVMPKQPAHDQFCVARVTGKYRFEEDNLLDNDFGHVIPVAPDSVRTFDFRASTDAYTVSSLFSRANHRYPVTFARGQSHIQAVLRLLESTENLAAQKDIVEAALDDAIKAAAQAMQKEIQKWNGLRFQSAVQKAFEIQGYNVEKKYRTFDGKGGDVDIVVSPPSNNYSLFMPQEIAVQVKWKSGGDEDDIHAVEQLVKWRESDTVKKFVISSADRFTDVCKERAEAEDVTLIGGLNTMYFLMGIDRVDDIG